VEWWTILICGGVVWWLWPKLFGNSPPPVQAEPLTLDNVADRIRVASATPVEHSSSVEAFRALETVRDQMIESGASEQEIAQLIELAPTLLRIPKEV